MWPFNRKKKNNKKVDTLSPIPTKSLVTVIEDDPVSDIVELAIMNQIINNEIIDTPTVPDCGSSSYDTSPSYSDCSSDYGSGPYDSGSSCDYSSSGGTDY